MQLPSSLMTNVKALDVASLKSQQGPISDGLKKVASNLQIAPEGASRTSRIEAVYDHLIQGAQSGNRLDVAKLREGKAASLGEAQFENQNGFARQVNLRSIALYETAQAGGLQPFSFDSKEEALAFAERTLSNLQDFAATINRNGGGDPTVDGEYTGKIFEPIDGYDEFNKVMQQHVSSSQDNLEASRMLLFVDAEMLSLTFGTDAPIYEVDDGQVQIRSFDISYNGETIAHSAGGAMAEYGENGTLKMDKSV